MLICVQQVYGSKGVIKYFLENIFAFLKITANLKKVSVKTLLMFGCSLESGSVVSDRSLREIYLVIQEARNDITMGLKH